MVKNRALMRPVFSDIGFEAVTAMTGLDWTWQRVRVNETGCRVHHVIGGR